MGADDRMAGGGSRELSPARVDLWLTYFDDLDDPRLLADYRAILTPEEREQETRFHFESDRRRYLVARALVRTILSEYASDHPADWRFSPTSYGRPEIVRGGEGRAISFNLSHTDGLILLAVTGGAAIGVDVENVVARKPPLEIANRFFAAEEAADLDGLPLAARPFRFYEYWTLKEAYIKARGMGLSIDLGSFHFSLAQERIVRLHVPPGLDDVAERWRLWQFTPRTPYLAALCVEDAGQPPEICAFEVVPLVSRVPVPFAARRRSPQANGGVRAAGEPNAGEVR